MWFQSKMLASTKKTLPAVQVEGMSVWAAAELERSYQMKTAVDRLCGTWVVEGRGGWTGPIKWNQGLKLPHHHCPDLQVSTGLDEKPKSWDHWKLAYTLTPGLLSGKGSEQINKKNKNYKLHFLIKILQKLTSGAKCSAAHLFFHLTPAGLSYRVCCVRFLFSLI